MTEEKQQNYTVAEGYELPSKGKIYDKPVVAKIELRSMTTREEMRRLSPSNTPYKTLADIIESCLLVKPSISVYDMCIGDYEYLLHKLRIVSYGPEYKMSVICPKCGNVQEETINLDDLKTKEFDEKGFKELQTLKLPACGKILSLNYQTPRTLDEIDLRIAEWKKHNKKIDMDPTLLVTLQLAIDTVDGQKLNALDLEDFINNLAIKDTKAILRNLTELNRKVGLDNTIECSCHQCGYDIATFFRFTNEFFGPSDDR